MTLGCGIISKNTEALGLDTALSSIKGVDKIYITICDREEPTEEIRKIAEKYQADLTFFQWENRYTEPGFNIDFAKARNFNMSQCKEDWYVWLDSDDTVEGMEKAKGYLSELPPSIKYVICTYNYSFFPSGKVDNAHPKERFIKMGENFEWKGALHENCITEHRTDGTKFEDIVWNHHTNGERSTESCYRNIRIVEREIEEQIATIGEDKVDPRTVFNLGMAYSSYAQKTDKDEDWEESIKAFLKYLKLSGWDTHAHVALRFIGNAHLRLGRPQMAADVFFECIKIYPQFKDGYASLGAAYMAMGDRDRAKHWFQLSLLAGEENGYVTDRRTTLMMPIMSLAEIYAMEGKIEDAEKFLVFGLDELKLESEEMRGMLAHIRETKEFLAKTKKEREHIQSLPEGEQKPAFDALEPEIKSSPELIAFRRMKAWKKGTSGKELVIHTGVGWEEWNPTFEESGIGGSEEAVINIARELQKIGWEVSVYGNHGLVPKEYEGVWYYPYWAWSPLEETDVFIAWRDPTLMDTKPKAKKKYVWFHDTNPESSLTAERLKEMDKLIVLSKYHRSLYPNIPDEKIFISSNGLIPEHFDIEVTRNPKKAMYVSSPNRGLLCLLRMWPEIKRQVPEAELYWAYGWDTYDIMMRTNPSARAYKNECLEQIASLKEKNLGFTELGRIGHKELAKHMKESGVWLYPTEFCEIFCISAIKAQAAGMFPVTTTVAALDETVQFGDKLDVPDIYFNEEAQKEFIKKAVSKMQCQGCTDTRGKMETWAKETWGWAKVASEWDKEFSLMVRDQTIVVKERTI